MTKVEAEHKIKVKLEQFNSLLAESMDLNRLCKLIKTDLDIDVLKTYLNTPEDIYDYIKDDMKKLYDECVRRINNWQDSGVILIKRESDLIQETLLKKISKIEKGLLYGNDNW